MNQYTYMKSINFASKTHTHNVPVNALPIDNSFVWGVYKHDKYYDRSVYKHDKYYDRKEKREQRSRGAEENQKAF